MSTQQSVQMKTVMIEGKPFEAWEDPNFPFGDSDQDLAEYAARGQWALLWNALTIVERCRGESGS
jgi:hypothetical protein